VISIEWYSVRTVLEARPKPRTVAMRSGSLLGSSTGHEVDAVVYGNADISRRSHSRTRQSRSGAS